MACYYKLLYDFAHPANRWNDPYISVSEKRLRWLKLEAFGNTQFKSSVFNIRRAHISNRNLQQKLGTQLSFYANTHGKQCDEIEFKQAKLWKDKVKRDGERRQKPFIESCNASIVQSTDRPFSLVSEYTIFQHIEAHVEKSTEQVGKSNCRSCVSLLKFDRSKHEDMTMLTTAKHTELQRKYHITSADAFVASTNPKNGNHGTRMDVINGQYKKLGRFSNKTSWRKR